MTGITGFIAWHVAKQFLEGGYKVRGIVAGVVSVLQTIGSNSK